jgi:hypothetical protein
MLHYLDDLDSKMEAMRAQFERGGESEGAWTGYNPSLGRPLLNTAKFLAGKAPEEESKTAPEPSVSVSETAAEAEEKSGGAMTSAAHEDKI